MSNFLKFRPERRAENGPLEAGHAHPSMLIKIAALRADARSALGLLANQFEIAMQHAREIEPRLRDAKTRQQFGEQIELIQQLLDVTRIKILQL